MSTTDELFDANDSYASGFEESGLPMPPARKVAVVACIVDDTGIRPPFALESFTDLDADVRQSLARITNSPFVPHKNARGFVYDVNTGALREVAP